MIEFQDNGVMKWMRVEPPLWWPRAGKFIVADRHLPDGTRQHMVAGKMPDGCVIANAEILGEDSLKEPVLFSTTPSHLSNTQ